MSDISSLYETEEKAGAYVIRFKQAEMLNSDKVHVREEELKSLIESTGAGRVLLDFELINFLNSTGLSLLITLMRRAQSIEKQLELCALQPQIDEVLKITQFHKLFEIHPTVAAAIQA